MHLFSKNYGTEKEGIPLVILHGLLGMSDNWKTLSKEWAKYFPVYVLDLRNHGRSPHHKDFDYFLMSKDLHTFLDHHAIDKCNLLGHSMGGKVAMLFSILTGERVNKLIVADIEPKKYNESHGYIFRAMKELPLKNIGSRKEADEWIQKFIPSYSVRQFILKNLKRAKENYSWRPNLEAILKSYQEILGFPNVEDRFFSGETLFVKGGLSDYIDPFKFDKQVSPLFPKATLKTIENAGHWLHAESPRAFKEIVIDFIETIN